MKAVEHCLDRFAQALPVARKRIQGGRAACVDVGGERQRDEQRVPRVGLAPAQLPTVKQTVADNARRYFASGTMSFPAEAFIVSGRKSGI